MGNVCLALYDCIEFLKHVPESSVDALVTDPPAGISFMGKEWDKSEGFMPFMRQAMGECLRVLKPGAHALVWAIPRTSHWTATALEDSGFEIRDVITHLFGSGFPKSMNISIAIDKQAGAMGARGRALISAGKGDRADLQDNKGNWTEPNEHAGITPAAIQWQGFGTALKPASEHWILARKPISEKTIAANVLKYGTGGINIDGCRVNAGEFIPGGGNGKAHKSGQYGGDTNGERPRVSPHTQGRFPSNLVLSHNPDCVEVGDVPSFSCTPGCAVAMLDRQSGVLKSGARNNHTKGFDFYSEKKSDTFVATCEASSGGASRFFYCAKASKSERNKGCEGMRESKSKKLSGGALRSNIGNGDPGNSTSLDRVSLNHHPTIKPLRLMRYLIRLVTPPGGIVLDPFMGSGSTGVAALQEGFQFIGIEKEKEYLEVAEKRIAHALTPPECKPPQLDIPFGEANGTL